jgi:phospholipase A1
MLKKNFAPRHYKWFTTVSLVLSAAGLVLLPGVHAGELEECMMQAMKTAPGKTTIADLRLLCDKKIATGTEAETVELIPQLQSVEDRIHKDREHVLQPFTLMTHKPNYLLFASYNASSYNPVPFQEEFNEPDYNLDDVEAKFQLSVKFPLLVNLANDTFDIYAAYTNRSFWQVYNTDESSPFRETNHEPEVWVQFHPRWEFFGFTNAWNSFGAVHQSNGRGGVLSRSWNRVYGWFTLERGNLAMSIKPWYRLPEDAEDDNNPDIDDYLGHYELSATYKWNEHVFSIMSRNNLESGFEHGAVELSWSFPLGNWPYLKGYAQYFNGYGESLIDYDKHVNTFGIGISLSDWL